MWKVFHPIKGTFLGLAMMNNGHVIFQHSENRKVETFDVRDGQSVVSALRDRFGQGCRADFVAERKSA